MRVGSRAKIRHVEIVKLNDLYFYRLLLAGGLIGRRLQVTDIGYYRF